MQGVDHIIMLPRPAEDLVIIEASRSDGVQVRQHLQRCPLPRVDLPGDGRRHRQRRGDGSPERRVIEARAYHVEGDIGALQGSRVARARDDRRDDDLGRPGPDAAVPEEAIDFAPGRGAGLADARQSGKGGEGIAQ